MESVFLNGTINEIDSLAFLRKAVIAPEDLIPKRTPELPYVEALPERLRFSDDLASEASVWLNTYINWSRRWSPRAHDDFHEAVGLWILSTVAARRIYCELGGRRYPNLYIALASRTSVFAKSTTAKLGMELVRTAGLKHMLAADDSTPQKFISDMVQRVPDNWAVMNEGERDSYLNRIAFSGQRGWFYDEFGQKLGGMMKENGIMADFRGILRKMDENEPDYKYGTISRGDDVVNAPYLALLANLTPADLKPHAKRGGALWNDGFWARFAFITPPEFAQRRKDRFPNEKRTIPSQLVTALRHFHEKLGRSVPEITERRVNGTTHYEISSAPLPEQEIALGHGVYDAYYDYGDALNDMISSRGAQDIDGNYSRLPEKALRISLLLASIENSPEIQIKHWARAQQIAERWRMNLHNLYAQVTADGSDRYNNVEFEDRITERIVKHGPQTRRELSLFIRGLDSNTVNRVTDAMVQAGVLVKKQTGRREEYAVVVEEVKE